ncbi:C-X-C motif chemokine 10-like [Paralichthys olivaceus]|uniref:C-X-C motif chemokine 10-like n=1 Tax=Paralichthys olivaceus TaxID=8255 RepID=UPI00097CE602|nr:PREDICTED: C-X-C motif chemokine 10-like [Paralichthys olivaceus]
MSGLIKVLLLLAAAVCISTAMPNEAGQNCLCQKTSNTTDGSKLKDIQIYPATNFCDRVEIVVTTRAGRRYCLNPQSKVVKDRLIRIIKKPSLSS